MWSKHSSTLTVDGNPSEQGFMDCLCRFTATAMMASLGDSERKIPFVFRAVFDAADAVLSFGCIGFFFSTLLFFSFGSSCLTKEQRFG
jgi:hypothetical protein